MLVVPPPRPVTVGPTAILCRHRGCTRAFEEQWGTAPTAVTAMRTVATVIAWAVAVTTGSDGWLLTALLCYWIGDIADGFLARLTHRETRTGAVVDVLADRLSICLIVASYVTAHPAAAPPAVVFLMQFVVLDAYLTLVFTRWSLLSPNYFDLVDATVYRLNWSPLAKATNTGAVVLVWLVTESPMAATVIAAAVLGVKLFSMVRVARLPMPHALSGCAVIDVRCAAISPVTAWT